MPTKEHMCDMAKAIKLERLRVVDCIEAGICPDCGGPLMEDGDEEVVAICSDPECGFDAERD